MSKFFQRFLAGIFMGFAEITPGISGATIAGLFNVYKDFVSVLTACLLYTSPSPRDKRQSRMPSSA